jgi:hypothetical protein
MKPLLDKLGENNPLKVIGPYNVFRHPLRLVISSNVVAHQLQAGAPLHMSPGTGVSPLNRNDFRAIIAIKDSATGFAANEVCNLPWNAEGSEKHATIVFPDKTQDATADSASPAARNELLERRTHFEAALKLAKGFLAEQRGYYLLIHGTDSRETSCMALAVLTSFLKEKQDQASIVHTFSEILPHIITPGVTAPSPHESDLAFADLCLNRNGDLLHRWAEIAKPGTFNVGIAHDLREGFKRTMYPPLTEAQRQPGALIPEPGARTREALRRVI